MADRNFDDIADKFSRNIYDTPKGKIRQTILLRDLQPVIAECLSIKKAPLQILDAGCGEGQIACQLAEMGHQVILCDISERMLTRAQHLAEQRGVKENMRFYHCSAQEIGNYLEQPLDLVLSHAVLEWVSEPRQLLYVLSGYLQPGGVLSLMFYNYNGLLFRNIQLGNIPYIQAGMRKKKRRTLSPDNPLNPQLVYNWIEELQFQVLVKSGVRVFYDYLQNKQQSFEELLALEMHYCHQEPFISLGRYIHVIAQKQ